MNRTKHTPGPWHIVAHLDEHDRRGRNVLVSEHTPGAKFRVHAANFCPAYGIPQVADARLIAAAPDMLAALEHAYAMLTNMATDQCQYIGHWLCDDYGRRIETIGSQTDSLVAAIEKATQ